jgi:carotenoid cleavage dioxygenase
MTTATTLPTLDDATVRRWFVELWRPSDVEERYEITDVDGEIPRELRGTLYRNGPSQRVLPRAGSEALHLFDGDALVHAIRFEDGRAHYADAFVQTETTLLEGREGAYCLAGVNLPADRPLEAAPMRVQPNTNVALHGGRLLALVENAPPFELDPQTLASRDFWRLDDRLLGMSTTAHPKIDGRTGQMVIHGYGPVEPYLQLYVIEPDGRISLAENVEAPYPSMMHDVAITEHYVIFPLAPVVMDAETLFAGAPFADALSYQPERGMKFGVRRREPGSPTTWIDAPTPGYMFHFGNAYEDGGKIVFDVCFYPCGDAFLAGLRTARSGRVGSGITAYPTLYEIDVEAATCRERRLDDRSAEFPRLDDRLVGYRNRVGYAAIGRREGADVERYFSVLTKYDRQGGRSQYHDLGRGTWVGEPVFVPRTPEAAEDDGFVLSVVYDGPSARSSVLVLDARDFAGEPLARLWLRNRVPMGFHGNFAPGVV